MLVNQCSLVTALIEMLEKQGGNANYRHIGHELFYIPEPEPGLIRQLLHGLLDEDTRFVFCEDRLEMPPNKTESNVLNRSRMLTADSKRKQPHPDLVPFAP